MNRTGERTQVRGRGRCLQHSPVFRDWVGPKGAHAQQALEDKICLLPPLPPPIGL